MDKENREMNHDRQSGKMRRGTMLFAFLSAVLAMLALAGPALAAPSLSVEIEHEPSLIHRNDEWAAYNIKVKNTALAEATNGQLNVFINLPEGLVLHEAEQVSGWKCDIPTTTCSNSAPVQPGAYYPTLRLSQVVLDSSAPETPVIKVTAAGGGASKPASAKDSFTFAPAVPFGLESLSAGVFDEEGNDYTQAGGHPYEAKASFVVAKHTCSSGPYIGEDKQEHMCYRLVDELKEGFAELPPGLVGSPAAVEQCTVVELQGDECPASASVGGVGLWFDATHESVFGGEYPVFRITPEKGYAAEFGFKTLAPTFTVRFRVRSDGDYGLTAVAPLVPQNPTLFASDFTFCSFGVKKFGEITFPLGPTVQSFTGCRKKSEAGPLAQPVVTLPTNCSTEPVFKFAASTWPHPGAKLPNGWPDYSDPNWKRYETPQPAFTGCEKLVEAWTDPETGPSLNLQPDVLEADSPAGYTAHVHVDNTGLKELDGLGASHLRNIKVVLPEGVTFNPGVGDGVQTCSEEEMGRLPGPGIHYDFNVPKCPPTSKLGIARVDTPLLENPLKGGVYLAPQFENPFHSDYAIYLVLEEPDSGLVFKLPGEVTADPKTGQITSTFEENPQLPFEDLTLSFFGGPVAALANPSTCSSSATNTELTPWAAEDPYNPKPEEIAHFSDPLTMTSGPHGTPCVEKPGERPFNLGFEAGSDNSAAASTSPFTLHITRPDGSQEINTLDLTSPPGFSAYLKGIPYCPEAAIAAAEHKTGLEEKASPSCPLASRLGSVFAGAGAGSRPLYTPGNVYLAGPYKGAPLSIVSVVPALAGGQSGHPAFDLGTVVVRSALYINRATAQVTAKTDPIPRILKGVVLRIRDVRIRLDRPHFTLNPTSCDANAVSVHGIGSNGAVSDVNNRFQVGGCENLSFGPKLKAHLSGPTRRGGLPAFTAEINFPEGQANTKDVQVTLPHSEFLEQAHIDTICTRPQAAAHECPEGSIYGYAEAETPLLDGKLTGPVFLKSSEHKLPDLAIFLKGPDSQPIEVEFAGRIDSVKGQIRDTIEGLPDVPVSRFVLQMKGGKKGLLTNSRNLCATKVTKMTVRMVGQNNKLSRYRPPLNRDCSAAKKKAKSGAAKRAAVSSLTGGW